MKTPSRFSPEVRERAVRMVLEHQDEHDSQWAAIVSIAEKIGCAAETLRHWVRQAERDQGRRPGADHGRAPATLEHAFYAAQADVAQPAGLT